MSTKSKVLESLETNKPNFVSGEKLAQNLGLSRSAVWKAIKTLEREGYKIDSSTRKGYRLLDVNDLLSEEGIRLHLNNKQGDIFVFNKTASTNLEAKKLGIEGYKNGTIVVADEQIQGRGRFGRTFISPKGKGIYLSLIVKPLNMNIEEVSFSTILTVVGVMRALKKFTDQKIKIKWVNDLYVGTKKISGILTELVSDIESGNVDFIVVGIGININAKESDFPRDLRKIATSINVGNFTRNEIIAEITNEVLNVFENFNKTDIIEEYKKNQLLIGKIISYEKDGLIKTGIAKDISSEGCLVVEVDKKIEKLNSGEVSVQWNRKKE